MSREIKFRAWDKIEKKMWNPIVGHNGNLLAATPFGSYVSFGSEDPLMQYTGLKDKNGKEVYEGDLVDDKFGAGQIKEIRWNEKTACFCYYCKGLDFSWDGLSDTIIYGEVIGNIHENKELLDNAK